jgi:hypothetical protein
MPEHQAEQIAMPSNSQSVTRVNHPGDREQRHPLMSLRPLTLMLAAFWMLVIASVAWLRA